MHDKLSTLTACAAYGIMCAACWILKSLPVTSCAISHRQHCSKDAVPCSDQCFTEAL